jgi:para-nitrobenzyl esterase
VNERLYDVEGEYGGLAWRAMGADEPISRMSSVQGGSVWAYRFDWDEQPTVFGADLSKMLGAAHAMELFFVFGLTDLGFGNRFLFDDQPSAERLSRQMRSYWANFAHTLRPGRGQEGDLLEWAPWDPEPGGDKYLIFDSDRDGGIEMGRDEIDQASILRRASKEPRLLNDEERCRVFRNFVQWSSALTPEQYLLVGDGACAAFPIENRIFFPSLSHPTAG